MRERERGSVHGQGRGAVREAEGKEERILSRFHLRLSVEPDGGSISRPCDHDLS